MTESTHVVVAEDDPEIASLLSRYLTANGFSVTLACDGAQLRGTVAARAVDLVLLDLGLPDEDGLVLLRHLQTTWSGPVIVVSGRGESIDRVVGLELGADDYVTKPFDLRELLARMRSVLRRSGATVTGDTPAGPRRLHFDGCVLDLVARRLTDRDGSDVALTDGEFRLLRSLLESANAVLSRDDLMTRLHGRTAGPFDRAIDVGIARLRRKVEHDATAPQLIRSVRGAGYVFAAPVRRE